MFQQKYFPNFLECNILAGGSVMFGWAWHRFFSQRCDKKTSMTFIAIAVGSIGFVAAAVAVSIAP